MANLATRGADDPAIRARARDFFPFGAGALRAWLVRRVRFVPDPPDMELVKAPAVMLQEIRATPDSYAVGDCDDVATLGAAIALAMGLPVRFVLLGFELGGPFSHVYADAWSGGRWVELDTTKPAQFPPGLQTHRRATFDL